MTIVACGLIDGLIQRLRLRQCPVLGGVHSLLEVVGPSGFVVGIDLADKLLELARSKAERRLLKNVSFHRADMLGLNYPVESFDAVICVFGIFFVPDMSSAVQELWRFVCPGGRLAITTWGSQLLEAANSAFWEAIRKVRPELHKAFHPWDHISDPHHLRHMLRKGGVDPDEVITETRWHPLRSPDDWWTIVMGTGYRGRSSDSVWRSEPQ